MFIPVLRWTSVRRTKHNYKTSCCLHDSRWHRYGALYSAGVARYSSGFDGAALAVSSPSCLLFSGNFFYGPGLFSRFFFYCGTGMALYIVGGCLLSFVFQGAALSVSWLYYFFFLGNQDLGACSAVRQVCLLYCGGGAVVPGASACQLCSGDRGFPGGSGNQDLGAMEGP